MWPPPPPPPPHRHRNRPAGRSVTVASRSGGLPAKSPATGPHSSGSWRARRRADLGSPPRPSRSHLRSLARRSAWPDRIAATLEDRGSPVGAERRSPRRPSSSSSGRQRVSDPRRQCHGERAGQRQGRDLVVVRRRISFSTERSWRRVPSEPGASWCASPATATTAQPPAHARHPRRHPRRRRAGRNATGPRRGRGRVAPGRYVAGEESALVSWLNGGPGVPVGGPTSAIPCRSEAAPLSCTTPKHSRTWASSPATARRRFALPAGPDAPGTALVTVSGDVEHPALYEVAMGTSLGAVIHQARPMSEVHAVLTGGFGGTWIPTEALAVAYAPGPMASVGGGAVRAFSSYWAESAAGSPRRRAWRATWPARAPDSAAPASSGSRPSPTISSASPPATPTPTPSPGSRIEWRRWTDAGRVVTPTASPAWSGARCRRSPLMQPRTVRGAPAHCTRPTVFPSIADMSKVGAR